MVTNEMPIHLRNPGRYQIKEKKSILFFSHKNNYYKYLGHLPSLLVTRITAILVCSYYYVCFEASTCCGILQAAGFCWVLRITSCHFQSGCMYVLVFMKGFNPASNNKQHLQTDRMIFPSLFCLFTFPNVKTICIIFRSVLFHARLWRQKIFLE